MHDFMTGISSNSDAALRIAEGLLKEAIASTEAKEWIQQFERCKKIGKNLALAVLECASTLDNGK